MRRGDIGVGRTYANRSGAIHRTVTRLSTDPKFKDSCVVHFEVTKGRSKRHHGEEGRCTMTAFAAWAKYTVRETV